MTGIWLFQLHQPGSPCFLLLHYSQFNLSLNYLSSPAVLEVDLDPSVSSIVFLPKFSPIFAQESLENTQKKNTT